MGIITNVNIYAALILPVAILVKGHDIKLARHMMLFAAALCIQVAESLLLSPFTYATHFVITQFAGFVMQNVLCLLIEIMFFAFVLNDNKAGKVFKLAEYDDNEGETRDAGATWLTVRYNQRDKDVNSNSDNRSNSMSSNSVSNVRGHGNDIDNYNDIGSCIKATALTCVWTICYTMLNRWIGWYRVINSLGFEGEVFFSALAAFAQVLCTQYICLLLCSHAQSHMSNRWKYNITTTNVSNNSNNNSSNSSRTNSEESKKNNQNVTAGKGSEVSAKLVCIILLFQCAASVISSIATWQLCAFLFPHLHTHISALPKFTAFNTVNNTITLPLPLSTFKYIKEGLTSLILFVFLTTFSKLGVV